MSSNCRHIIFEPPGAKFWMHTLFFSKPKNVNWDEKIFCKWQHDRALIYSFIYRIGIDLGRNLWAGGLPGKRSWNWRDCEDGYGEKCNDIDDARIGYERKSGARNWRTPSAAQMRRQDCDPINPLALEELTTLFLFQINCFSHNNDHWKTAPLWTDGPFCACVNSNTNTYSCVRTINATHNYLYCEFVSGIITYYNLKVG